MRIRLLPVLILVAVLAVSARLSGLAIEVAGEAQADRFPEDTEGADGLAGDAGGASAEIHPEIRPGSLPGPAGGKPRATMAAEAGSGATAIFQRTALAPDPLDLTDQEIDLLQSLAERREQLARRERQIEQRGALLSAAEARLEEQVAELEALKASIEALLQKHDAESGQRIASLVKIYSSMKAKDAARIFEELETDVLLRVIRQMPERVSAAILAEMNPRRAKTITVELAEANALPRPRE